MCAQRVVVLGAERTVGASLVAGLTGRGLDVLPLADPGDAGDVGVGVGAVVDAGPLAVAPPVGELGAIDASGWQSGAEEPLRRALQVLRAARRQLPDGGRIAVLLPSLVATGAAGVVPWVAAAEGYRSLVKAAARTWGSAGVTVNCVLVPADLVTVTSLDRPGLQPPALGPAPATMSNVVDVVAALVGGGLDGVTGQTIAVDGGVWMTP
jgi:3-oxoacyl-[acyl-carrier protein] reductase